MSIFGNINRIAKTDTRKPAKSTSSSKKGHPERQVQDAISKFLLEQGFIVVHVNSGVQWSQDTKMPFKAYTIRNTGSNAGFSDLLALKENQTYLIEVKTDKGRQSDSQKKFELLCKEKGVNYSVCRCVDDVKSVISVHKKAV